MPEAFEDFLRWGWSEIAYRHIKDDPARDVLDFSHAALSPDNRWNHAGEPAIYLAGDPGIAIAEFGRHLEMERSPLRVSQEMMRRIFELRVHNVDPLLDLRDPELCAALHLRDDGPHPWFYDKPRCRAVAAYLRHITRAKGLLTPPMPTLDSPEAWNLVLFLDKLPKGPRDFLTIESSLLFGFGGDQPSYPISFATNGGSNLVYEPGAFQGDKLDDVTIAMTAVSDSLNRMNAALDRRNMGEWHYVEDQMSTAEDILESVAAHVADGTIRMLEGVEAELSILETRFAQLEAAFNSCFGATPASGTWDPAGPQMTRDSFLGFREELVNLARNSREQAVQAAFDSQDPSDPHFARTAAAAARVKDRVGEVAGRATLRMRRMVARLDNAYGTSGEAL